MVRPAISGRAAADGRPLARPADADAWHAPGVVLAGGGGAVMHGGGIAVVADARLDNRDALAAELGLARSAGEGAVIAAAYARWGEDALPRLEGAFAFALWDAPRRRLLCARDMMGMRPFHYRHEGASLAFAQTAGALADGARAPRDAAVADFLHGRVLDADGTWFAGVRRLTAGHSLVFERGTLRLRCYRRITPLPPGAERREPAEALRARLDAAVARRAQGEADVGVLLSGGLDSSSIACLLRDQRAREGAPPLPVYAMMFREPERSSERRHFDAVVATGGFAPRVLELDGYAPFDRFEALLDLTDGPTLSPNLACMRHVAAAAAERGTTVLLDGHGGDEVVSHGYGLLDELAARGAWLALLGEARGAADNYGRSRWVLARRIAARHRDRRLDARIIAKLLAPLDREAAPAAGRPPAHLMARDLVERSGIAARLRAAAPTGPADSEAAHHLAVLADPLQAYAFEVHAAFYRGMGVTARYPFWDREVVEFCLSLPAEAKLSRGWSRLVLRRAMGGIVPASILARRDKLDFTVHLARGLVRHHHERLRHLLASPASPLAPYLDRARAEAAYATIAADPDAAPGRLVQMVWRAASLGIWLESGCGARAAPPARLPQEAAA